MLSSRNAFETIVAMRRFILHVSSTRTISSKQICTKYYQYEQSLTSKCNYTNLCNTFVEIFQIRNTFISIISHIISRMSRCQQISTFSRRISFTYRFDLPNQPIIFNYTSEPRHAKTVVAVSLTHCRNSRYTRLCGFTPVSRKR